MKKHMNRHKWVRGAEGLDKQPSTVSKVNRRLACEASTFPGSRLHVFIAHSRHSSSPKDHELTKLQPPNDFKIRNSDDLHVKILLQYFELIGKHCG